MHRKIIFSIFGNIVGLLYLVVGSSVILNNYGKEYLGLHSALILILGVVSILDFGLPAIAVKEISNNEVRTQHLEINNYLNVYLIQSIIIFVIGFLLTYFLVLLIHGDENFTTVEIIFLALIWAFSIVNAIFTSFMSNIIIFLDRSIFVNTLKIFVSAISLMCLWLIARSNLNILFFYSLFALINFISIIIMYYLIKTNYNNLIIINYDIHKANYKFKKIYPQIKSLTQLTALMIFFNSIDKILIAINNNNIVLAEYTLVSYPYTILNLLSFSIATLYYSKFCSLKNNKSEIFKLLKNTFVLLLIPSICVTLFLFERDAIIKLYYIIFSYYLNEEEFNLIILFSIAGILRLYSMMVYTCSVSAINGFDKTAKVLRKFVPLIFLISTFIINENFFIFSYLLIFIELIIILSLIKNINTENN
jgi:hypothetical protein